MAPSDTLFIEKTNKSSPDDLKYVHSFRARKVLHRKLTMPLPSPPPGTTCSSFLSMRMWDLPGGQLDPEQLNLSFEDTDAVIFVLDAQSALHDVIRKLSVTMHKAYTANPGIQFEIFLHKVDGMSEDYRLGALLDVTEKGASCVLTPSYRARFPDTLQNLRDRLTEELFDMSPELESNMNVFYHLTSVFDTSIYEALSKVIQKLIPEQAMLERLLDLLCQVCLDNEEGLSSTLLQE